VRKKLNEAENVKNCAKMHEKFNSNFKFVQYFVYKRPQLFCLIWRKHDPEKWKTNIINFFFDSSGSTNEKAHSTIFQLISVLILRLNIAKKSKNFLS
jgi:hypothetical protein